MTISNQYTIIDGIGIVSDGATHIAGPANRHKVDTLKSIRIPSTVTEISGDAFLDCINLKEIVVEEGNPVYDSRGGCNAVVHTESNTLCVGCKTSTIPDTVESIGKWAFYKTAIEEIIIPSSVFEIQNGAFANCAKLKSVVLSEGLMYIYAWAFANCIKLKSVTFPESLEMISNEVFIGCRKLETLHIPPRVEHVDSYLTSGCHNLQTITVDPDNPVYDSRENCNAIIISSSNTLQIGCAATRIPEGVVKIACGAFASLDGLEDIVIPESVLDIEELAFHGNSNLEEVVICGPLKHLRQSAFSACESLKRLYLPVGIKKISATFDDCNLKEISVPLGKVEYYKRRLHESLHTLIVENFEIPDVPFDIVMNLIIPGPITETKRKWLMRQREACKRRCEQFEVTVVSPEEYLDKYGELPSEDFYLG